MISSTDGQIVGVRALFGAVASMGQPPCEIGIALRGGHSAQLRIRRDARGWIVGKGAAALEAAFQRGRPIVRSGRRLPSDAVEYLERARYPSQHEV
jgi:hypothetical protein